MDIKNFSAWTFVSKRGAVMFDRFTAFAAFCCLFVFLQGCPTANPQPDVALSLDITSVTLREAAPSATVMVINAGEGRLRWTATSNDAAISVAPSSFVGNSAEVAIIGSDFSQDYVGKVTFTNTDNPDNSAELHVSVLRAGCGDCSTEIFMLPGDVPLTMVGIPAGTFQMGSTDGNSDEAPVHSVTISHDFQMGRVEVTKAQWEAVMGTTPWSGRSFVLNDPDSPAVYVSWNDAQAFITALNSLAGETFRLPTEAEWEYACRAGSTTEYYFGDSSANLGDYAWWDENADNAGERYAHIVAQLLPNDFGLYDMHGNVWEWCNDWYSSSYYSSSPSVDPMGPDSGSGRVRRGGGWGYSATNCRSGLRGEVNPADANLSIGFRLSR